MNPDVPCAIALQAAQTRATGTAFCVPGTICFELVKGLPVAFVALVIGLIAAGIAYRQYTVSRAKLNLDLFERRYAIFEKTWEYLSSAVQGGPPVSGFSSPFDNLVPQASFLFGKRIEDYMRTASRNMTELWLINTRTKARGDIILPEDIARHRELLLWFVEEAQQGARQIFGEYLDFSEWR
jgi:hypothetical protein